jgi:alanyl-tRNA synthetase
MTRDEIREVELKVNAIVRENIILDEHRSIPISEAEKMGALMLFGEKYGDMVRVIKFGDSMELCGGTHVKATGEIGFFKIITETAIAAGIRRIEAVTSEEAQSLIFHNIDTLDALRSSMRNPKDIHKSLIDVLEQNSELGKQIGSFMAEKATNFKHQIKDELEDINGIKYHAREIDLNNDDVKKIMFELRKEVDNLFLLLATRGNGKAVISVAISDDLVKSKGLNAGQIIRNLSKHIQGGGGGQPFYATAGGKNVDGIEKVLLEARALVKLS